MENVLPAKITSDFVWSQVRVACVAAIAYLGGTGYFSPAGVTLSTALLISLGPILVPWAFSIYANIGKVSVTTDSKAAIVASVENAGGTKADIISAVRETPEVTK